MLIFRLLCSIFIVFAVLLLLRRAVLSLSYISREERSTRSIYIPTCMRRSGCFPGGGMELSAFASHLFAPNCLNRLFRSILILHRERA